MTIGGMEVEPKGTKQRTCLLQQKVMTINDESNDARGEDNKKKKNNTRKKNISFHATLSQLRRMIQMQLSYVNYNYIYEELINIKFLDFEKYQWSNISDSSLIIIVVCVLSSCFCTSE